MRGLQARRMRGGSGTLLVQRPTKATKYVTTKLTSIANQLSEDAVAVITSRHDNADSRCWCTCLLAQVIWCIGKTQGDAHTIASSVLAVAVVTVRLCMHCAGTAITNTTNLDYLHPLCNLLDCIGISSSKSNQQLPRP